MLRTKDSSLEYCGNADLLFSAWAQSSPTVCRQFWQDILQSTILVVELIHVKILIHLKGGYNCGQLPVAYVLPFLKVQTLEVEQVPSFGEVEPFLQVLLCGIIEADKLFTEPVNP